MVSSVIRSSISTVPSSSWLISVRRASLKRRSISIRVFLDDRQNVRVVRENAKVFANLFQQFAVLVGEPLLLEVDQLTEGHPQNGVGLHGSEAIDLSYAAIGVETLRSRHRPGPAASWRRDTQHP